MKKWYLRLTLYLLCSVAQSCPILCNPMDCSPPGSSVHGDSPGKNTGVGCHALLPTQEDLPNPGIKLGFSALYADSLLSEPPGKPKNTGVGSLSLFQGIFPAQECNWGLLHCCWILYQLSYQGSPCIGYTNIIWEPTMEKAMAPRSSTLVWKIPRMEEPGRLQSMESRRVGHDWATSLSLSLCVRHNCKN